MKILILKDVPGEIIAKKMTYNIQEIGLAIALRKKGHCADILCCSDDDTCHEQQVSLEGQQLTIFSAKAIKKFRNGFPLNVDCILAKYDVLHVCEYNEIYTWHLAKKYSNKMICYHGPYYNSFNKNYNRMAKVFDIFFLPRYRKLNTQFITKSELAAEYLKSKGLKNVEAIGVGLNTSFLSQLDSEKNPDVEQIKKAAGLRLLYIGTIEPRRNTLFILNLMNELKKRGIAHTLILIGKYKDDEYERVFKKKVQEFDLQSQIMYVSRVEQKYLNQVYRYADVFLLPTIYDIYGMVLLEAMYFGVPTLTTVNGGSNMMIKNGENGFVFDDFNVSRWCDCIETLYNNPQDAKRIGQKGRETINSSFTWDVLADKFILAYERKLKSV